MKDKDYQFPKEYPAGLKEIKNKTEKCSICGDKYVGFGNNADPVNKGRCCDLCNTKVVIPVRISLL